MFVNKALQEQNLVDLVEIQGHLVHLYVALGFSFYFWETDNEKRRGAQTGGKKESGVGERNLEKKKISK